MQYRLLQMGHSNIAKGGNESGVDAEAHLIISVLVGPMLSIIRAGALAHSSNTLEHREKTLILSQHRKVTRRHARKHHRLRCIACDTCLRPRRSKVRGRRATHATPGRFTTPKDSLSPRPSYDQERYKR